MLARLARVFLVVTLLAGWQAALQHPIEHVDRLGEFVHLQGGNPHGGSDGSATLCDALNALTACAPGAAHAIVAAEQFEPSLSSRHESAPRVAEAPPFFAQGPPASV